MTATFYALCCLTASGLLITWSHGNPRIVAIRADSGLFRQDVCVTFPKGSKYNYHAIDICPDCDPKTGEGCRKNQVDILVNSREKARRLGVMKIQLDKGECKW